PRCRGIAKRRDVVLEPGRLGDHVHAAPIAENAHAVSRHPERRRDHVPDRRVVEAQGRHDPAVHVLSHRGPRAWRSSVKPRRRATTGTPSGSAAASIRITRAMYDKLKWYGGSSASQMRIMS